MLGPCSGSSFVALCGSVPFFPTPAVAVFLGLCPFQQCVFGIAHAVAHRGRGAADMATWWAGGGITGASPAFGGVERITGGGGVVMAGGGTLYAVLSVGAVSEYGHGKAGWERGGWRGFGGDAASHGLPMVTGM